MHMEISSRLVTQPVSDHNNVFFSVMRNPFMFSVCKMIRATTLKGVMEMEGIFKRKALVPR